MMIRLAMTTYIHPSMAFTEALNKLLMEQLFKVKDTKELNSPEKVSSTLVKHLYELVDCLDDTEMQMTGMKPKDAIKLKEMPLVESYPPEDTLIEDRLYCYLVRLSKEHDDLPWIEYGQKAPTGRVKSHQVVVIR